MPWAGQGNSGPLLACSLSFDLAITVPFSVAPCTGSMGLSTGNGVGGACPAAHWLKRRQQRKQRREKAGFLSDTVPWAPSSGAHAGQREAVPSSRVCAGEGCWPGMAVMGLLAQSGRAIGLSGQGGCDCCLFSS